MKNIMIIGDSYSTFKGYIPEGYATYYDPEQTKGIDVASVNDTWWYKLCAEEALNLVLINTHLKPEITNAIIAASEHFGINSLILDSIDKINGHPTAKGMEQAKVQIAKFIKQQQYCKL